MSGEQDGLVRKLPNPGENGNGHAAGPRYVELHVRFNLDTGELESQVIPNAAVQNRMLMYGILGMMHDIVYRQQLPGELAVLQRAQEKQIVLAPDGAVPPFPGRM